MDPLVSVVVLNWEGLPDTRECLESLFLQDYPNLEIHLVDNGSRGEDGEVLEKEFGSRVRLYRSSENLGFSGGNNLALREILAEGKAAYAALLNNDAVADPGWVTALVRAAEEEPRAGLFASRTVFYQEPDKIENAGVDILSSGDAVPRGRGKPGDSFPRRKFILGACAGAALYRTSMLEEVGLFREDFFANFEDVDLSLRAGAQGWKCLYVPEALVRHRLNRSIRKVRNEDFHVRSLRNLYWAVWTNLPWQVLALNLPWMFLRVFLVTLLAPLFGQPEVSRMVRRALKKAWSERDAIRRERARLAPRRRGSWLGIWLAQKSFLPAYYRFFVEAVILRKRGFLE